MLLVTFFVICLTTGGLCQEWVNDYDGYLYFECPEGQSITRMISIHSHHDEHRMWAFECSALQHGYESCSWSGYVNNYDEVTFIGTILTETQCHHETIQGAAVRVRVRGRGGQRNGERA